LEPVKKKHSTKNRGEVPSRRQHAHHEDARGAEPLRKRVLLKGESNRKRLGIPMYQGKVV